MLPDDHSPENADSEAGSPLSEGDRRPPIFRSEDLMQGHREIWIEHGDAMYRLRITQTGKLFLTK